MTLHRLPPPFVLAVLLAACGPAVAQTPPGPSGRSR